MSLTRWVVCLALCSWCAVQGAQAADAAKTMTFDDCKTVLEKLKTDGAIKTYGLSAGERGLMRLDLGGSGIVDLTPLKGMPLSDLVLSGTKVTDLSPLLECPDLEKLVIPEGSNDLEPLRKMKNLKFISNHFDWWTTHAEDFWKAHDNPGQAKLKRILDKLQADGTIKQYKLDPGENGLSKLDLSHSGIIDLTPLKGMPIEWLHIEGSDQDPSKVETLAGLEGMPLKELRLWGNIALEDISAIQGAPLSVFVAGGCHVGGPKIKDISAFKGMKLKVLGLNGPVTDLSPLAGMPIEEIQLWVNSKDVNVLKGMPLKSAMIQGPVTTDISALKGMPLKQLSLRKAYNLTDLSPLQGMPLDILDLYSANSLSDLSPLKGLSLKNTGEGGEGAGFLAPLWIPPLVTDLSPLAGMPLKAMQLNCSKITDLTPLKEMLPQLQILTLSPGTTDISPLKGLKLKSLNASGCDGLADISVLASMPLEDVNLPRSILNDKTKGLDALRKHATLKTINGQPAAEFWKKRDDGKK